ncbi:MAG TPA: homoserine dehydrogenase, partial [Bacteroidetes bacterium]|nr:homoserine dehydrogenase [Bacteroidota bacterium]
MTLANNTSTDGTALRIGLFGFGCVGQGLYDVLRRTPGLRAQVARICVKDRSKPRTLPLGMFTYDRGEILGDDTINVVVELIDDANAAFDIVSSALRAGKAVVSANKR